MAPAPSSEVRAVRDARIVEAARNGETRQTIAEREGLTDRQVRRILARQPAHPTIGVPPLDVPAVLSIDPIAELAKAIATHRDAVDRLRTIATHDANGAVAVGAARSAAAVSRDLLDLLRGSGLLPGDLFTWGTEMSWATAWAAMGRVAERRGIDLREIEAEFEAEISEGSREPLTDVQLSGVGPVPVAEAA